jgi:hypothetical protein
MQKLQILLFLAGLILIGSSLILGFLIEKLFKYILKFINCWSILILVLIIGYGLNFISLNELKNNSINLNDVGLNKNLSEFEIQVRKDLLDIWDNRNNLSTYSNEQISKLNTEFIRSQRPVAFCGNRNPILPTNFAFNMSNYDKGNTFTCYNKVLN